MNAVLGSRTDASAERWTALGKICLGIIFAMTPWFSATAILPELREHWQLDDVLAAWMTNAVQIGFVLGALGSSITGLPDLISVRKLMAISALFAGLLNFCLLIAPNAEVALILRLLTGVALALIYPPAMKLVTTWFVKDRGLALGLIIGGLTLGSAFPHLIHSITSSIDWRFVVSLTSILSIVAGLIFAFFVTEGPFSYTTAKFQPSKIGKIIRDRSIALANLGYFGHMWELYAMWGWFLVYIRSAFEASNGISIAQTSLIVFVVISSGIFGCILGGYLSDRIGRTATTALMMGVSGSCALLIGFVFNGPEWLLIVIAIIWGISIIGDSAQFSAILTEIADRQLVGTALAFQMGIGFALTVISIQILPILAERLGSWQWTFIFLAPGPIIGVLAMLVLRRMPEAKQIAQGLR